MVAYSPFDDAFFTADCPRFSRGLKFVAKDRLQRINGIAERISESSYDLVTLQELWVFSDYQRIREHVSKRLPYAKFFYSGALGAGLSIFSRFPIISVAIHPYALNGHPVEVSDWFVGKAAASVVISHPVLKEVEIFNTHLFAKGGETGPEHLRAHRLVNAWELAKLVRTSATIGRYVIVAGDLNGIPKTLPMTVIRDHAGLTDAWVEAHPQPASSVSGLNAVQVLDTFGVTADSPLNSYSAGKPLDPTARAELGKRLDYILYRHPLLFDAVKMPHLECKESRVVLTEHVPGYNFSYSDHFGIETILDIVQPYNFADANLPPWSPPSPTSLSEDSFTAFQRALTACYRISKSRSKFELSIFVSCVFLLLLLCVGSAWIPFSWINPIIVLLSTALAWLGTTMLYSGFIFGNWERRALTTIIEELELVQQVTRREATSPLEVADVVS